MRTFVSVLLGAIVTYIGWSYAPALLVDVPLVVAGTILTAATAAGAFIVFRMALLASDYGRGSATIGAGGIALLLIAQMMSGPS